MMGIVLPETCWACNKICNKYHLLHLVGILFPYNVLTIFNESVRQCVCAGSGSVRWCCVTHWHTDSFYKAKSRGRRNTWQRATGCSDATQRQLLRFCSLGSPLLCIKDPFSHQMANGAMPRSSLWPPGDTNIVTYRLSGVLKLGHINCMWPIKQQTASS